MAVFSEYSGFCSHQDSGCFMLNLAWALEEEEKALNDSQYIDFFPREFWKIQSFIRVLLCQIYSVRSSAVSHVLPQCVAFVIGFLFFFTVSFIDKPSSLLLENAKLVTNMDGYLRDCMEASGKPRTSPKWSTAYYLGSPLGPVSFCVGFRSP